MALKHFPPVSSIPLGAGLSIDSDGKVKATGGGGGGEFIPSWPSAALPSAQFYLSAQMVNDTYTTLSLANNRIYWVPFIPQRDMTLTALAIVVTTAGSSSARVGIYGSDANGKPTGAPLVTSTNFSFAATGKQEDTTVSLAMTAGTMYQLAVHGGTGIMRAMNRTALPHLFTAPTTTVGISGWYINNQTFASGLPTAPAGIVPYNSTMPAVFLKVTT
jgi:hypothetical protein